MVMLRLPLQTSFWISRAIGKCSGMEPASDAKGDFRTLSEYGWANPLRLRDTSELYVVST